MYILFKATTSSAYILRSISLSCSLKYSVLKRSHHSNNSCSLILSFVKTYSTQNKSTTKPSFFLYVCGHFKAQSFYNRVITLFYWKCGGSTGSLKSADGVFCGPGPSPLCFFGTILAHLTWKYRG